MGTIEKRRSGVANKLCAVVLAVFLAPSSSIATPGQPGLTAALAAAAPDLNRRVLNHALAASRCAVRNGIEKAQRLAVIDYSLPSSKPRLWIFDLGRKKLLLRDYVAHGRNSGDNRATDFSNRVGSHQSSLGLFRAAEAYYGKHGYSLRMDGLEPGINDNARDRAIVIHGAGYVDPAWIERQGRIGRSLGCPAVRKEIADQVVDSLRDGQLVFTYYPDSKWLKESSFLSCGSARVATKPGTKTAAADS